MFTRGDVCYILENNMNVVQVKVVSKSGRFYIIQKIGSCGAIKLSEKRLFATAEEAEDSKLTSAADVNPQVSEKPGQHEIPDVYGKNRVNRNPHAH